MPLLISFCNQTETPDNSLLLLDENTRSACWIGIPPICVNHVGCTGIQRVGDLTYVLTQAAVNPHLVVYDGFFRVLHCTVLTRVRDPHSLCYLEGFLYLVSTANNSVYRLRLAKNGIPEGEAELYWRYPSWTGADQDLIHLNSIGASAGQLFVSCFGPKAEQASWKTSTNGLCFNISDQDLVVADGVQHPHSISFQGDTMFLCSSSTNEVILFEPSRGSYQIKARLKFHGYIRGFAYSKESYFIGQSESRQVSRSRGTENGRDDTVCQSARIHVLNHDLSRSQQEIDVSSYGAEIYDILYLPQVPFPITGSGKSVRAEFAGYRDYLSNRSLLSRLKILNSLKHDELCLVQ